MTTSKSEPGGGCGNGEPARTQSANCAALEVQQGGDERHAAERREDDDDDDPEGIARPRPGGRAASSGQASSGRPVPERGRHASSRREPGPRRRPGRRCTSRRAGGWWSPSVSIGWGGSASIVTSRIGAADDPAARGRRLAASGARRAVERVERRPAPPRTMSSSRPSVGSIGWRGPIATRNELARRSPRATRWPTISIVSPSATIRKRDGSRRASSRTAAPTYAPNRSRRFHSCSAAAMTRASRPIPQATVKSRSWASPAPAPLATGLPTSAPARGPAGAARPDRIDVETPIRRRGCPRALGQDVAGPGRDDRQRRLATDQRGGRLADGPVATDDDDERGVDGRPPGPPGSPRATRPRSAARRPIRCSTAAAAASTMLGEPSSDRPAATPAD